MAKKEKISIFLFKVQAFMERHALWFTLFASVLLLLFFYDPTLLSRSQHQDPYLPIENYSSLAHIPLWNPAIYSGMPIWGNPQDVARINIIDSALFSLLKRLQPVLPDIHYFYLLLNLLACCGFMYGLMRQLGIRPAAAACMALLIPLIPQMVIDIVDGRWLNIFAFCLTPAILYFTLLLLEQRKLLWFVSGAFFFSFQLLRASAAVTIMTLILILVFYVVYSLHWRVKSKVRTFMSRGALCLSMVGVGFLLAGYVYLPLLEFMQHVVIPESSSPFSLQDIFLYAYPSFNGQLVRSEYRFIPYLGVVVLFLAGFAILLRRNWRTFLLLSASIACIALSFSGFRSLPAYAIPFIFLILAGIGFNALAKYRRKDRSQKRARWLDIYMLIVWGVLTAGFIILLIYKSGYMQHVLGRMPLLKLMDQNVLYRKVLLESAAAFALTGLSFLIIRLYVTERIHIVLFSTSLLLIALCDYLIVDRKLIAIRERGSPALPAQLVAELQEDQDVYRIFSTTNHSLYEYSSILGETKSVLKTYYAFLDRTGLNEADVLGMRNPFFSKYTRLMPRGALIVEEPIPVDYIDPVRLNFDRMMLDMLNVKYIICQSPIHDANYSCLYDSSFFVYKNSSFLPRAFFVDSVFTLPGRRAIFDAMHTADYDPRRLAFLEQDPPFTVEKSADNSVEIASVQPGRMDVRVDVKRPAALVLSEVYYPVGWRLFVDEKKADLYKTNYFLKSVFLQPGLHRLKIEFQPTLFRLGALISGITLACWFVALAAGIFYFKKRGVLKVRAR